MKCKECVSSKKKSKLYIGTSASTAVAYQSYWDEDGKWHSHNPNKTTTEYSCSLGHQYKETTQGSCECGWPEKKE